MAGGEFVDGEEDSEVVDHVGCLVTVDISDVPVDWDMLACCAARVDKALETFPMTEDLPDFIPSRDVPGVKTIAQMEEEKEREDEEHRQNAERDPGYGFKID